VAGFVLAVGLTAQGGIVTNAPAGAWSPMHRFAHPAGAINWQLYSPPDAGTRRGCPLVLWLHGGAKSIGRPDTHTPAAFTSEVVVARYGCYVLAPAAIAGRNWVSEAGRRVIESRDLPAVPTASLQAVMALLDRLLVELPLVDPRRICVGGASGGGYGTWALLQHYPGRFAAAFPVAGGGVPAAIGALDGTRIWIFHGARDRIVPPARARDMFNAVLTARGEAFGHGELPGMQLFGAPGGRAYLSLDLARGHSQELFDGSLATPGFMDWLFAPEAVRATHP
jgi:poly(3-hydroxybutyrate) depolymerase